jgi:hypothetical protein
MLQRAQREEPVAHQMRCFFSERDCLFLYDYSIQYTSNLNHQEGARSTK